MIIDLSDIGNKGFHIVTHDFEEMFIVQIMFITQAFIVNLN